MDVLERKIIGYLPILYTTELFQSASLSSVICKLLSTMHASLRLLQQVHEADDQVVVGI